MSLLYLHLFVLFLFQASLQFLELTTIEFFHMTIEKCMYVGNFFLFSSHRINHSDSKKQFGIFINKKMTLFFSILIGFAGICSVIVGICFGIDQINRWQITLKSLLQTPNTCNQHASSQYQNNPVAVLISKEKNHTKNHFAVTTVFEDHEAFAQEANFEKIAITH